jgi:hypothetical protein
VGAQHAINVTADVRASVPQRRVIASFMHGPDYLQ